MKFIKYYILSLFREDRKYILDNNLKNFPFIETIKSVDGYSTEETIRAFKDTGLAFRRLSPDPVFFTYGTLANFITKYKVLELQVSNNIPYVCFIEDDLLLSEYFIEYTESLIDLFRQQEINSIRLDKWGEGYITSLQGAKNIIASIKHTGIIENIDNQLNYFCGPQAVCNNTPWQLVVGTNEGDCLKTARLDITKLQTMNHFYHNASFGQDWFDYSDVYSIFVDMMSDNGHFVEIGSWKGKSSAFMAVEIVNSNKKIRFDCIDTWQGSDEQEHKKDYAIKNSTLYDLFLSNIAPVRNIINPIRSTSKEASKLYQNESIDIVFIDACHSYECVKEDISLWLPKVKKGGILAGHDYTSSWPGVVRAVNELLDSRNIKARSSCWIYEKPNK